MRSECVGEIRKLIKNEFINFPFYKAIIVELCTIVYTRKSDARLVKCEKIRNEEVRG